MTPSANIPAELDEQALNFLERGLSIAYGYYTLAPAFFWAGVGLLAWAIAWRNLAKMKGGGSGG